MFNSNFKKKNKCKPLLPTQQSAYTQNQVCSKTNNIKYNIKEGQAVHNLKFVVLLTKVLVALKIASTFSKLSDKSWRSTRK